MNSSLITFVLLSEKWRNDERGEGKVKIKSFIFWNRKYDKMMGGGGKSSKPFLGHAVQTDENICTLCPRYQVLVMRF